MAGRVYHHVWFKWKAGTSEDAIRAACTALAALKSDIPVIRDIHAGKSFTERSKGYSHGLTVVLDSKEDLPTYSNHPAHVAVVNDHIKPIAEDVVALDYVIGEY